MRASPLASLSMRLAARLSDTGAGQHFYLIFDVRPMPVLHTAVGTAARWQSFSCMSGMERKKEGRMRLQGGWEQRGARGGSSSLDEGITSAALSSGCHNSSSIACTQPFCFSLLTGL